ncbi:hypothetical protein GY21_01575 [Cryobacterium roopkundense]|uniref:D-inositol 3-phosphate glycosyltransferase n=1 Tax=Cryobacterium roopkundense TaxID=1001240 RepID=A0A099JWK5_9MICO|nr:glycosyltransferase family 4 protein [Cryobacterium roopkundense]KGJ81788.1 hypothetical protein GY21_01575 [Cryobacterium roopkundense]MBB5642396.1 glycosyltransferase involved in cell wall biosynthesis [Cryobacterium roopkundense]
MRRVVILQEYIPTYRVPFFEALRARAAKEQIDVVVACGRPNGAQDLRGDSSTVEFVQHLPQREVSVFGRRVVFRRVSKAIRGADLVILEQARRNLDSYWLLGPARRRTTRVALWGHGRDYTRRTKSLDRIVQRWLTRRADWFFAYTEGGVAAVTEQGYPRSRTTLVQNSIDTTRLRKQISAVTTTDTDSFRARHDLRGKTALFVGALDESKRLPFLLEAAKLVHNEDADFRLIVAGDGALRDEIESWARTESWVTYLGQVGGDAKSVVLASAQVMAMPGRVGLVAVDSFAAATPIVTTDWAWHAPESEYLVDGVNAVITADDVGSFADALTETLANAPRLAGFAEACQAGSEQYTLEAMVENYVAGILSALEVER